ncbi:MAG: Sec-independent protein translocase protein TatB, partial [Paracoccaceae bacterium]
MFDIGWTELLVIGIVALIVVGPKDLPGMFRTLGRFTAKARGMAKEFSRAMEEAADESGVKDVAKTLKDVTSPKSMGLDAMKDAASKFEKWDPMKGGDAAKGPETVAFTKERAAAAEKMRDAAANKANERIAAKEAAEAAPAKKAAPKKTATKKPATKKPAAKKPAAKKAAVKK